MQLQTAVDIDMSRDAYNGIPKWLEWGCLCEALPHQCPTKTGVRHEHRVQFFLLTRDQNLLGWYYILLLEAGKPGRNLPNYRLIRAPGWICWLWTSPAS